MTQTTNQIKYGYNKYDYNRSVKSWLEKTGIEMYSVHNEGKSVVVKDLLES